MNSKLTLSAALALAVLALPSCMKMNTVSTINKDATGTISLKFGQNTAAIEKMKEMAGQMGGEEADEGFKKMDEMFDEKKAAKKLEEQGVTVTSSKVVDKDGWKTLELEGTIKDVNVWVEKSKKQAEEDTKGSPMEGMGLSDSMQFSPKFYKTETQGVGQIVLIPNLDSLFGAMGENPLDALEDMGDEEREMIEGQIEMMKQMFAVDQMTMEITVKLPGTIVATKGCKKADENTVTYSMKGADVNIDSLKDAFGMKNGVSATFNIPEGCKINFEDAPKAKVTEEKKEAEGEKKEKKGGLKIGEEEGKKKAG